MSSHPRPVKVHPASIGKVFRKLAIIAVVFLVTIVVTRYAIIPVALPALDKELSSDVKRNTEYANGTGQP